jgi:thiol-disulfide isomerase/thioredoxin
MTSPASPGLLTRIGLALVAPRWAMAVADTAGEAGRSGTDLIRALGVLLLSVHTRRLVAAVWLAVAVGFLPGLRGVAAVLSQALTIDLAFLVVATMLLWVAAGPRRALGRAFDQVCVAAIPLVAVEVVATTVVRGAGLELSRGVTLGLSAVAYGWGGALVALGWRQVRRGVPREVPVPPAVAKRGRIAGLAVTACALVALVLNTVWIVRNADLLRPVTQGDPAPAFVLPEVRADGTLGAPVELASTRGKVVVLDFWATWCDPCIKSLPSLARLRDQLGADGVVLTINLDDPAAARKVIDAVAPGLALVYDNAGVRQRYGVGPVPHTVVLDRAGRVEAVILGGDGDLAGAIARVRAR